MARSDKNEAPKVEQVHAPDFAKMKRIIFNDIKPADDKTAKNRGDLSQAWGAIERDAHCNKKGVKWAYWLLNQSEESRDDVLRSMYGAMKALGIGISADLVDKMSGDDAPTMPTVDSKGLGQDNLATLSQQRSEDDARAFDNDAEAAAPAA